MKKLSIILISVLVALAACTKSKEVHPEIGDGNDEIMTVGMKDVHVEYTRTDHAELQKVVFHYSLAEAQQFAAAEMTKQETFFELTLNDLLSDTLYYYYYELFPKGGSAFLSEQKTFHTQAYDQPPTPPVAELPTVVTAEVSEITENSAICGGEVTNDGGAEVTERGICWSTNANPTLNDSHIAIGTGIGEFTATVSGLDENTTYHVRAYATNEKGTAYGLDKEFTTLSNGGTAQLPVVVTNEVTGITAHSATCGGEVTNDGGAEVTERGVCWSTSENPNLSDSHVVAGDGVGTFAAAITGLNASTTYHVRAYATNEVGTAYGLDREFATLEGGGGSGEHEYVDLGLPSGTLWATCNVGADNPEDYGDYFAWGETQPKSTYNWSTYQYCMGSDNTLTKYCNKSSFGYNGFTDNLTTLLPEDDAATANWGSGWRMPTQTEWQELLNNTTVTWTTQNGVNGRLFTASNGNSLFLPAAGYRNNISLDAAGGIGFYWSSSLDTGYPGNAWRLGFGSTTYSMADADRRCGRSVRAVRSGR